MPAKGSGAFGPDVVVGSAEYAKLWREKNREKMRLAQVKYRQRQRLAGLALKLAREENIPVAKAIEEIEGRLSALTEISRDLAEQQKIAGILNPVAVEDIVEIPYVRDLADKFGVDYETAERIMDNPNNADWPAAFEKAARERKEGFVVDKPKEAAKLP